MIGFILFFGLLTAVWFVPAWLMAGRVQRGGGWPLGWAAAVCALSLGGWTTLLGWENIRGWMIPASLAAPYAMLWLAALCGRGEPATEQAARWQLPAAALLLLVYGAGTTYCCAQYYGWRMTKGSGERATLGQLAGLRSSLQIYSGDTEGGRPPSLESLIPKYLSEIPRAHPVMTLNGVVRHPPSRKTLTAAAPDDGGGWVYNPADGTVRVNCTHPNLMGETRMCDH
ncbi:MAG: hypothetical protein A2X32_07490 [Elusimicrobia bacterium GWC2_64_44]|nr:MAG: hypothetical protein A2X32_07490 [Elusimicrobia bacterium GWC2_64_44]